MAAEGLLPADTRRPVGRGGLRRWIGVLRLRWLERGAVLWLSLLLLCVAAYMASRVEARRGIDVGSTP